jgi:hypothetical protein
MSSKVSTIFGHSSVGARRRSVAQVAPGARAENRAGHRNVERLDRVIAVSTMNASWTRHRIPDRIC